MVNAIFIHDMSHYLHPSSLDLTELANREQMAAYLRAPYPSDRYLESFTTAGPFGRLDFWFSSWPGPVPRSVNRPATELLMSAATFRTRTVPLLRGRVMLTSHDSNGDLLGLTDNQIRAIALHANRWRTPTTLEWRYAAAARTQRRRRKAAQAARKSEFWDRLARRGPGPAVG